MFGCLFVCLYICLFSCFNNHGTPIGSFPENFVKIRLDFAEILRISNLDWCDRGEGKKGRRGEGKKERRNPTL